MAYSTKSVDQFQFHYSTVEILEGYKGLQQHSQQQQQQQQQQWQKQQQKDRSSNSSFHLSEVTLAGPQDEDRTWFCDLMSRIFCTFIGTLL